MGHFIRAKKTVTDNLKYGEELEEIPDEMVGLTDQNAQLSERAKILHRKKDRMIGKGTHIVDCRETMGMGEGGGIAQRGTFAQSGSDVLTIAMSPGRRHITKPVCEITFALREANIMTSTLVLNAGAGVPHDAPSAGGGSLMGLTPKEIEQINLHKLIVVHLGGVKHHIVYKARLILRHVEKTLRSNMRVSR